MNGRGIADSVSSTEGGVMFLKKLSVLRDDALRGGILGEWSEDYRLGFFAGRRCNVYDNTFRPS